MKFVIVIDMRKNCTLFFLSLSFTLLSNSALAQSNTQNIILEWEGVLQTSVAGQPSTSLLRFEGAEFELSDHSNPIFALQKEVSGRPDRVKIDLLNTEFVPLTEAEKNAVDMQSLLNSVETHSFMAMSRGKAIAVTHFVPIRKNEATGMAEKLVSFQVRWSVSGNQPPPQRSSRSTSSVMASGDWYRIGVPKDGVYRMSYQYLKDIGVDVDGISSDAVNVYGNGVGLLPTQNGLPRPDDLQPNSIQVVDGNDGSFDPGDYLLFFARGPQRWRYDTAESEFRHVKHLYTDTSYYYIGVDVGPPKRMATQSSTSQPATVTVTDFDDYAFHEIDQVNLLKSGRTWYGEVFDIQNTHTITGDNFTFPNIKTDVLAKVRVDVIARTLGYNNSSNFQVTVNGGEANEVMNVPGVSGIYTQGYAKPRMTRIDFMPGTAAFSVKLDFIPHASTSKGWLNFISINVRRSLKMEGSTMLFRDMESVAPGQIAEFNLSGASSVNQIWDVTDPNDVTAISFNQTGSDITFRRNASTFKEYLALTNFSYPEPRFFGAVPNQNLHALGIQQPIDMMVVTHPKFYNEAVDLANYHINHPTDPVYCEVVTNQQVYNEFSSGMPDITAIKDLMRMLYDRANGDQELMPKYLLLFGDGSYDNKSRAENNTNYVLTYQSENSFLPVGSYVSDDYFGLLDNSEGESSNDKVDIGVGRIPVGTAQEAQDIIKKLKNYMSSDFASEVTHCSGVGEGGFGEWRNRLVFVGDDEDGGLHMSQSNQLAAMIEESNPEFNITKIYLDAFQQVSSPGGNRYPEVSDLIKSNVQRGALLVNYVGHGGEVGWAEERILDVSTIRNWNNFNSLPLFVTATCEFTRFDDPGRTSAGEYVLLNSNGAGVSLLSTTRLVTSGGNMALATEFYKHVFTYEENPDLRLGDIFRTTKSAISTGINKRSFALIGDPALKLAYPQMKVYTTSITDTLGTPLDTLKALGNVKISGYVGDKNGILLNNFNGTVAITVFDKATDVQTLSNDGGAPFHFSTHKNVIYRGKALVEEGLFDFSFIVPKDINLSVDPTGRLSYYAVSDLTDATGYKNGITVGSIDENAAIDETGPIVELYMNDENFVTGGTTDENPTIYAMLRDESGINMVGTGIGHDLTAVVNDNNSQPITLNDFYESDLNTFKSGSIRYPLEDMSEGLHKLRVKVWDVHNNSGEGYTEFVVANSEEFALEHVLNYPNPFTTYTEFSFEHNQVCAFLNVQIQIFTISGKLIKTINTFSNTNGFRVEPIAWNGLDDYGDQLARGVYVYRIKVKNPSGEKVEKFEKLVILK